MISNIRQFYFKSRLNSVGVGLLLEGISEKLILFHPAVLTVAKPTISLCKFSRTGTTTV